MKNKKIMYIWVAVVIIIVSICLGLTISFSSKNKEIKQIKENRESEIYNEQENEITNELSNILQNEIANELINEVIVNEIGNIIVEDNTKQNTTNNNTSTEKLPENQKTAEEMAIEIVKKDWGTNKKVEFLIDGKDENNNYIVSVRDSKTTKALAFYSVNVTTKKFTKREMN